MSGAVRRYVGIDPGLSGAIAVLVLGDGDQTPRLQTVCDLPLQQVRVGRTDRPRLDLRRLSRLMDMVSLYQPARVAIEEVQGRGNQVGGSMLSYIVGVLHGTAAAQGVPFDTITPSAWKAKLRCPVSKRGAVDLATAKMIYPEQAPARWANVIDSANERTVLMNPFRGPRGGLMDGRAEAALIAYWAWFTDRTIQR